MNELTIISPSPIDFLTEIERDPHLKSDHTRRQYRAALSAFETWRASRPLTLTLAEEYAAELQKSGKSPNTVRQAQAVIRWWARRVAKLARELVDPEQARQIAERATEIMSMEPVKGSRQSRGRHVEGNELAALLSACTADPSPIGARDAALIAVAIATGCRNEELRSLTVADIAYTETGADLTIRHGKGDKTRTVYLFNGSLSALNAWIDVRGIEPGFLFCPIRKAGRLHTGEQITYEGTRKILRKRFEESDLAHSLTWHDFRRTLAGLLFDHDVDLSTVQQQLGHSSHLTTMKYDRRPENRRRAAIAAIEVPYKTER